MQKITLTPKFLLRSNILIIGILLILHLLSLQDYSTATDHWATTIFTRLFNFDFEYNLPSAYSAANILITSILCYTTSHLEKTGRDDKIKWKALSLICGFLAFDEYKGVHERLSEPISLFLKQTEFINAHNGGEWVYAYSVLAILFCGIFWRLVINQDQKTRQLLITSFAIYITGLFVIR